MAESKITTKEISPGLLLHKEQIHHSEHGRHLEAMYVFKVEVQKLFTFEFTADFTGSKNVKLDGKTDLVATKTIEPLTTETIAVLTLEKEWELKSRFRFTMKAPSKEVQMKFIQDEVEKYEDLENKVKTLLKNFPISVTSVDDINQYLQGNEVHFIDLDFPPTENSIYDVASESPPTDTLVHWRRPHEFMERDKADGSQKIKVFCDSIEPSDIKQGALGDCWLMSALASLAERPALVQRLFLTKEYNEIGVYRLKLCKNGEWVTVTVDDYFPCYPKEGPIFSRAHGNELWVLLLEKAYAKLHGNYLMLRGGYASEGLMDLTGCPCKQFNLDEDRARAKIKSGEFWESLKKWDEEGFLMSVSTPGEDKWSEANEPERAHGGLVPGHAYTVLLAKESQGHKLLNIRNPWGHFEWNGDWSDKSPLWTPKMIEDLNPVLNEDDGSFWMSYEDFLAQFRSINVCKVKNWEEMRIKGKFMRVEEIENPSIEVVLSKWYYTLDVTERTHVVFGLHQEDERISGVIERRQYVDVGLVVLRRNSDNSLSLYDDQELTYDRQIELDCSLEPGSYIVVPRTTGCTMRRPSNVESLDLPLMTKGKLSKLMVSTIKDIFRKFDMLLNRELTYCEFKGFCECISKSMTESEFKTTILDKYNSSNRGITMAGFMAFWEDSITELGEEAVVKWLEELGYDQDLYSVRSRSFILTMHSEHELSVIVRDAVQTDLDNRTNCLLIEKYGKELEMRRGVRAFNALSREVHAYSYGIINDQSAAIEVTLDCSKSQQMLFSASGNTIKKRIEPGQLEFMLHALAEPSAETFVRSAKCTWVKAPEKGGV
mmetsp:Transcript_33587/g.38165  ORF Transcript_33587/g.38165 Transcript_33587/m.38165 type:complete len:826 (+) Transcript_33587:44-2521(+)